MTRTRTTKTDREPASPARARRQLMLIIALFLLPVVAGTGLYLGGWKPQGKSLQFGELLQPARPLHDTELNGADGTPFRLQALRGRWTMILYTPLPCADQCRNNLYKMHQVRLAQGRDATRVQRVVIAPGASRAQLAELLRQDPGLLVLGGAPAAVQGLARELVSSQGSALDVPGRIYLVDPIGNLVLSYAPDADPTGMRKDLARLLRLSQVG